MGVYKGHGVFGVWVQGKAWVVLGGWGRAGLGVRVEGWGWIGREGGKRRHALLEAEPRTGAG